MESVAFPIIVALVITALVFDFLNGLHDAANSIATVVSTRVLSPKYAVAWAAFFNTIALVFFTTSVAKTIGTGIVEPGLVDTHVIFGALMGAIAWNVITWGLGIPSSSSHALIGGIAGAGIAKGGLAALVPAGFMKTGSAIVLSPLIGLVLAMTLILIVSWLCRRTAPFVVDRRFRILQFFSAAMYSLGHGGNDAQKTMGIITALLFSQGMLGGEFHVPIWVAVTCQIAMGLGTLFGGWRIVKTMGSRITDMKQIDGFCANAAGAATLFGATWLGIPVSTTHTITGAIIGVGSARKVSGVRWHIAGNIVVAWVITIPAAGSVAALFYWLSTKFW
ncbi:low-affinity inorganic phosphate transporter [Magnetospirillum sp. XM-1]|uniref:inorganic phosphate transporter n=1 Tax=Magnetospirillum sp. XM-1 TaxID=1663591 RepID=UPI00073DEC1B|nr:inorganic phosphate transporter [Magnetospirillum sp. XM-1]CUW37835.1 low-affinity inorganic phosphate transporter [Magnetospirillum sp. XM-1]